METTGALEANLARTAVEVVIPQEHLALLDITSRWRGVCDATEELLREVHHRYVGWPQTLSDLHRRAMGDFPYHNGHERGAEAIGIVCDLYAKLVREATPEAVRHDAVRLWLTYLDKVARESGDSAARNAVALDAAIGRVRVALGDDPGLLGVASAGLRKLTRTLVGTSGAGLGESAATALGLLRATLADVYGQWLEHEDPLAWHRTILAEVGTRPGRWPSGPEAPSHRELDLHRRALDGLGDASGLMAHAEAILALPDEAEIVHAYLTSADALAACGEGLQGEMARIQWLLRVLGNESLGSVHETAMREVSRACTTLLTRGEAGARHQLVKDVFALLGSHRFPFRHTVLALVGRIGRDILRAGDPDLVESLIGEMLDLDFEYPEFSGFTAEWGMRANPAHLEALRTYLGMVEEDPVAARRLLAALVVHLRLGGVSIPDSALFQRDVSALLASGIEPVYVQVKHLCRLLPVYFSEIGSEGELREVSTRIDEALHRRDGLCHFLRKQCHVECNPHLVDFVEEIAQFWATGDPTPLAAYVPDSVFADLPGDESRGIRQVFGELVAREGSVGAVFALDLPVLREHLGEIEGGDEVDRERAELLVRVWREIRRKYTHDHHDVIPRLRGFGRLDQDLVSALEGALDREDPEVALDLAFQVLERLQSIASRPGEVDAAESIYLKRHIAVGIPSMYGSYREERVEAMGLTFRLEALVSAMLEDVMTEEALPPDRWGRLRVAARWLHLLHRAVRVDGFRAQGVAHCLAMLDEALEIPETTDAQFLNVFVILSRNVESLVRARILDVYEEPVRHVVPRMLTRGMLDSDAVPGDAGATLRLSESFLRDLIAESFGLQQLDALVGRIIHILSERPERRERPTPAPLDLERAIVSIRSDGGNEGIVALGKKGFMLCQMARLGLRVPDGFLLTTRLFAARDVLRTTPALRAALDTRIRHALERLEEETGRRLGDPVRPLILSVRAGAPFSMPGMLTTFLNVGMNAEIAERVAAERGEWAAWDAYRRLLQSWGMSHGMSRDPFDEAIAEAKGQHAVPRKALLPPAEMRDLAFRYRDMLDDAGIEMADEPFAQLLACIDLVQSSWDDEPARLYRGELHIAEEWGTAVVVQEMVFGNTSTRSGTGVVFTCNPNRSSEVLELSGDFTIQSQGDDVVGGLVETHPITERQRAQEARGSSMSLEKDFPAIHAELAATTRLLVHGNAMNHQEIEFTFEGDAADDLYLLQTRDTVVAARETVTAFLPSPRLDAARVGYGIGVSGGALSGRVAHDADEIDDVQQRFPGDGVILLRPDTVPDDIALVLRCDGVLTALGGATSHAAVAAKRLGKTCVVGCRALDVDERHRRSQLGEHVLVAGDILSISGLDGGIYLGSHPSAAVNVHGRAQQ